jgi:hypothetical protein
MSISRLHTWSAGEILLASDLNSEFNNIINNATDLISPLTKALSLGGFSLYYDAGNSIGFTSTTNGLTLTGGALNTPQGADIVASATLNLDTATGNTIDVTGNTGITAVTLSQGRNRLVRFTGTPTITNGASLVVEGGADYTAVAGQYVLFIGYASSVVRCIPFTTPAATQTLSNKTLATPAITGHPTVEGITSTGATGTGKFVFDASPTITGHPTVEGVTSTGATGTGKLVFDGSPTLTTAVLGSSTATTQSAADNSTKVATTAYVDGAVGLIWIASNAPSAASTSSFSSLVAGARYKIVFRLRQNTSNGYLSIQFNADGGANYGFGFHTIDWNGSASSNFTAGTATNVQICNSVAPIVAGSAVQGEIEFASDPTDTTKVYVLSRTAFFDTNSRYQVNQGGGRYAGSGAMASVLIQTSAGTVTGDVVLYKYKT